jgi:glycosyltransferase involved in cell wall biosynthesis
MSEMDSMLSVIIPVFNEEKTVAGIIERVLERPEPAELIIVNDASTDETEKIIEPFLNNERIKFFSQTKNCGKGAAVRRGIDEASAPYVIIQDADFEYTPDDYPLILGPLFSGKADVVYGSRFMGTPGIVRYFRHEMGNKFLTFISNIFTDIHLSDMETCYKAFKREVIQNLNLEANRFGIEVELTAKIAKARQLRIYETPISYNPRKYNEGKKITWKDGVSALYHILKFNVFESTSNFYKKPWDEVLKNK